MENINDLAQNALATNSTTSQDETSNRTAIPTRWVSALFKHFQVIYGHKFVSMYDGIEDFAAKQWSLSLEGLTGEQIKSGLRACGTRKIANGSEDWPPTPAEFRGMCLPEVVPKIHRQYVSLPKPVVNPDHVDKQLSKMRNLLRRPA